jgi:hypothetical protein
MAVRVLSVQVLWLKINEVSGQKFSSHLCVNFYYVEATPNISVKAALLLCLVVSSAFALSRGGEVVPSPNKQVSVRYVWIADEAGGEAYIHCAILQRGEEWPWSFSARGRAMLFSWSPDARYLLVGLVKPGKDMVLYCLDAQRERPAELNLNLEPIEERVEAALPERNPDHGESVAFASHHQIDFHRVKWLSNSECRMHYVSQFDRKAGEATLKLDFTRKQPLIEIEKITPRGPK